MMQADIFVVTMSIVCFYLVRGTPIKLPENSHNTTMGENHAERIDLPKCDPACAPDEHSIPIAACAKKNPSNGCGPWYHPLLDAVGSLITTENATMCCDQHDACYSSCTTTKQECDNNLQECLRGLYKVFATFTEIGGCDAWELSKKRYCACENINSGKNVSDEPCPFLH